MPHWDGRKVLQRPQHGQLWCCIRLVQGACGHLVQGALLAPVLLKLLEADEGLSAFQPGGAADALGQAARLFLPRTRCQSLSIAERIWWTSLAATEVAVVGMPFLRCTRAEWRAASVAMRSCVHKGWSCAPGCQ